MSLVIHTVAMFEGGANTLRSDRLLMGVLKGVTYAAGSGAGASVTVAVSSLKGLPATGYVVQVSPDQDCTWFVTKTATGFTVTLTPRLAANVLASGALDILVFA